MFIYWFMYFIASMMVLSTGQKSSNKLIPLILMGMFLIIIIGFRFEVGGDWFNYIGHYNEIIGIPFEDAMHGGDPAHKFLNWLSARWDLGVYGTNVFYGFIFIWGLIRFARKQPNAWIVLLVAVPYLIIVVVMGYSRQGVAIGLFLLAVSYLDEGKFKIYIVFVLIAALFHKTALLLLPLGIFLYGKGLALRIVMIIPIAYGAWDLLLSEQQDKLWANYVEVQMHSDGAKIRVAMNLIPSLLLLIYKKEWKKTFNDYSFWFWIALGSITSVVLVNFASTAVDRVALYFIPIQLVVFSRLPYLARKSLSPSIIKLMIVFGYALVLFVWLFFATHSAYWIPYQSVVFQGIF